MYQEELDLKQGSAQKRFCSLKNEYEMQKRFFLIDILSEVEQKLRAKYMQNAPGFDARYLGVVVLR